MSFQKEIISKLDMKYSVTYNICQDLYLKVVSNSKEGLMSNYFSSVIQKNNLPTYTVYVVDIDFNEIDEKLKRYCENQSLRSKRIFGGYYNLHHFGNSVGFYREDSVFYIIGYYQFAKDVFWSYLIKWLLTEYSVFKGIHLKASCVQINNKGCLIIGDKSSGKSTLIFNLLRKSEKVNYISNTHVLIEDEIAYGVKSAINFRKDMALEIQKKYNVLSDMEITGCLNIDPLLMNYNLIDNSRIDCIIFYSFNPHASPLFKDINSECMNQLLNRFSDAINVYNLQNDVVSYFNGDLNILNDFFDFYESGKRELTKNTKNIIISNNDSTCEYVIDKMSKL